MKAILLALISICFLASCSGGLRIEKRQYRDGFYISTGDRKTASQDVSTERKVTGESSENTETEVTTEAYEIPEDTTAVQPEEFTSKRKQIFARVDSLKEEILSKADSVRNEIRETEKMSPVYNGPAEAKYLVLLQRIAWILFLSGIAIMAAGIIIAVLYWGFPAFVIVGPIAVLVSYGISMAVMILSIERFRKYAGKDPESAFFYRKLRNQAMVIVGIVSLFLLFTFFLWLVSITGFGF